MSHTCTLLHYYYYYYYYYYYFKVPPALVVGLHAFNVMRLGLGECRHEAVCPVGGGLALTDCHFLPDSSSPSASARGWGRRQVAQCAICV